VVVRRLAEIRKEKKKSLYWLAKQTGVSQQNLGRIESGKTTRIEFDILDRICESLDCQPGDLFLYRKSGLK
jgi:putative transcriptional regulator